MADELEKDNLILLGDSILVDFIYEPILEKELVVFHISDVRLNRVPRVYNDYSILPAFTVMTNENGELGEITREQREWEMVLPFSSGSESPRKQPTELIYKGKKLRNPFPTQQI